MLKIPSLSVTRLFVVAERFFAKPSCIAEVALNRYIATTEKDSRTFQTIMASELTLIVELVTVLGAATIGGHLANRLGQPVLLGYLLAGTLVGPAGLKLITTEGNIQVLAEIGVALLLFVLGVEFSLKDLLRLKTIAFSGSTLQILLTILT